MSTSTALLALKKAVPTVDILADYLGTDLAATLDILDNAVTLAAAQVLSNKTLTAPVINGTVTTTGLTLPALTLGGNVTATGRTITGGTYASPTFGGTVAGAPIWAADQLITLAIAAQPNVTSVGTLTALTVSGQVLVADGSAAAPSIARTAQATGLYFGSGVLRFAGTGVAIGSLSSQAFSANAIWLDNANQDVVLVRDAANTLAQRNGGSAQALRLYNTFTDASNYERGFLRWVSNALEIGNEAAGTGVVRALNFYAGGFRAWQISSGGHLLGPAAENADIGAAGATRPRNLYLAGAATIAGNVACAIVFPSAIDLSATSNAVVKGGSASFTVQDNAGSNNNLQLSNAGALTVRAGITHGAATLLATTTALTNGAAAATGTLTNAPAAGNPTKWVPINDNGVTRYIPAW